MQKIKIDTVELKNCARLKKELFPYVSTTTIWIVCCTGYEFCVAMWHGFAQKTFYIGHDRETLFFLLDISEMCFYTNQVYFQLTLLGH